MALATLPIEHWKDKKHKSKNNALFVGDAIADFHVFCDAVQGADVSGEVLRIDIKS